MIRPLLCVCASLALLIGCGGKVTFVAQKSGAGGGGAGGAGSTATTNAITSTVGTTGSGGSISGDCATICAALASQSCGKDDCASNCVATYQSAGVCQSEYQALLDCVAADPQFVNCQISPIVCSAPLDAFDACEAMSGTSDAVSGAASGSGSSGGGCVESCSASSSGCDCTGMCSGGNYEVNCQSGDNGAICACTFNGVTQMCNSASPSCDLGSSCCSKFFFPN